MGRDSRVLVGARMAGVTVSVLGLAVGGHLVGGGHLPPLGVLALLAVPLLTGSALLVRRELDPRTLVPFLVLAQLLVHMASSWLTPAAGHLVAPSPGTGVHAGHAIGAGMTAGTAVVEQLHVAPTAPMLLGHVVATAVSVALLVGTDRAARAARHWWGTVIRQLLVGTTPPAVPGRPRRPSPAPAVALRGRLLTAAHGRRGPPGLLATG